MWIVGSDQNIRINVWETSNNKSGVTLTVKVETIGAKYLSGISGTVIIDGTEHRFAGESTSSSGDGEAIKQWDGLQFYYSGSTRSVSISANINYYISPSWGNAIISGIYTATKPVYTAINTSAASVNLGSSVNIITSEGNTGDLTISVGGAVRQTLNDIGNTTTSWTPALATYAQYITNSSSAVATLTWNGVTKNITLMVPDNATTKPTVSLSLAPINGLNGNYIQGVSQTKATVSASGYQGASISSISISLNGQTYSNNPATSDILTASGANTCTVTVKDSRGFSKTISGSFTVEQYSDPILSNVRIYRSDSNNDPDVEGAHITFQFNEEVTPLSNQNSNNYTIQYRAYGSSTWTEETSFLPGYSGTHTFAASATISTTTMYQARLILSDNFKSVYSAIFTIPTAAVIMDFNTAGTGGGIGMYTQGADQLDVAWQIIPHHGIRAPGSTNDKGRLFPVKKVTQSESTYADEGSAWLKNVCMLYPNVQEGIFIGEIQDGTRGLCYALIYDTSDVDSVTGLPKYAFGLLQWLGNTGGRVYAIGTNSYTYYASTIVS